jgi:myo-inositol 2-dehydrogenase/D-chiro-inositol 1-dehydrogenase
MGAGRIGKMHAKFIAAHPKAKLKYIYDVNSQFAEEVGKINRMFNCIITRRSN